MRRRVVYGARRARPLGPLEVEPPPAAARRWPTLLAVPALAALLWLSADDADWDARGRSSP